MEDVRILFTSCDRFIPRLIRKITKSRTSHVLIECPTDVWGRMFIEAHIEGVHLVPAKRGRLTIVEEYTCRFPGATNAVRALAPHIGERFDYEGIFFIGLMIAFKNWFGVALRYPFRNVKAMKCSELVTLFFKTANLDGSTLLDPELVSPEDLRQYCEKHPIYFEKAGQA